MSRPQYTLTNGGHITLLNVPPRVTFTEYENDSDDLEETQREDFELGFEESVGCGSGLGNSDGYHEESQHDDNVFAT